MRWTNCFHAALCTDLASIPAASPLMFRSSIALWDKRLTIDADRLCEKFRRRLAVLALCRASLILAFQRRLLPRLHLARERCRRRCCLVASRVCCGVATVSPLDKATRDVRPRSTPIGANVRSGNAASGSSIWKQTYHLPHERLTTAAPTLAPGGRARCQRTLISPGMPTMPRRLLLRIVRPSPTRKSALSKRDLARNLGKPALAPRFILPKNAL